MMKLLADENVDDALISALRRAYPNVDIVRVQDTPLFGKHDLKVLEWAADEKRILITYDKKMEQHFQFQISKDRPVLAVFVIRTFASLSDVIESLVTIIGATEIDEWEGQFQFIPL
jgi:predicted nuclease of predicted toxin-antitoxin system